MKNILYKILAIWLLAYPFQSFSQESIRELPLPTVPDTIRVPADRADFVMTHFWDAMDFSDTLLTHDDAFMEQTFVNYLSLLPHAHQDSLPTLINGFIDRANINEEAYSKIHDLAGIYLNSPDSPMRNEEYYIIFLRHAVEKGSLNEAERGRAAFKLEMALKNRPGTKAPDFNLTTRDGDRRKLTKLLAPGNNVVIFYDPDCNHCAETIELLRNAPKIAEANVIAVDAAEDRYLWDATKDQLPEEWTVAYATDPIQDTEEYIFPEMPTIYLLDGNGTILLKEASVENLLNRLQ